MVEYFTVDIRFGSTMEVLPIDSLVSVKLCLKSSPRKSLNRFASYQHRLSDEKRVHSVYNCHISVSRSSPQSLALERKVT